MMCDMCRQHEATVRVTINHANGLLEQVLCAACAGIWEDVPVLPEGDLDGPIEALHAILKLIREAPEGPLEQDFLSPEFLEIDQSAVTALGNTDLGPRCTRCGTVWQTVQEGGRLGCANCYALFAERLEGLFANCQRATSHIGKQPRHAARRARKLEQISRRREHQLALLDGRLQAALKLEQYEEAARLRDKMAAVVRTAVA